jgi:hypothetical protein
MGVRRKKRRRSEEGRRPGQGHVTIDYDVGVKSTTRRAGDQHHHHHHHHHHDAAPGSNSKPLSTASARSTPSYSYQFMASGQVTELNLPVAAGVTTFNYHYYYH